MKFTSLQASAFALAVLDRADDVEPVGAEAEGRRRCGCRCRRRLLRNVDLGVERQAAELRSVMMLTTPAIASEP